MPQYTQKPFHLTQQITIQATNCIIMTQEQMQRYNQKTIFLPINLGSTKIIIKSLKEKMDNAGITTLELSIRMNNKFLDSKAVMPLSLGKITEILRLAKSIRAVRNNWIEAVNDIIDEYLAEREEISNNLIEKLNNHEKVS